MSTANAPFRLSDGAVLNLTVSTMGDRTGQFYGFAVPVDQATAGPATPTPGVSDATVEAGAAWLRAHPACGVP